MEQPRSNYPEKTLDLRSPAAPEHPVTPPATANETCAPVPLTDGSVAPQVTGVYQVGDQADDWSGNVSFPAEAQAPAPVGPTKLPRIAGYEILSVLGRGGMGVVYKGRQVGLNRFVALKMILAGEHADEADFARFRAEAEAVACLRHPNIVQIYEIGEANGAPFFSLEFVDGGSLATVLDSHPQNPREAASMVQILALAMQSAHNLGIVHRDLKPANILITREKIAESVALTSLHRAIPTCALGTPKIADFGLAKQLNDHSARTQSGTILGTPSYMAPEQSRGLVHELGPAVDVYSLGAILYEILTGRPPFRGASLLDTLEMVRLREPVPPSQLQPKIPRDLETICLKCLQKEPGKRYATASDLAEDLRRFLAGESILARPVGTFERFHRWCWRNPGTALLVSGIAAALVLGTGISTYFAIRATRGEEAAVKNAQIAMEKKDESDRRRYVAEYRWAMQKWKDGRIDETRAILGQLEPQEGDQDLRQFEWHYLKRLCHLELRTLEGHTSTVYRVVASANGRWLATAGIDATVRIWDRGTGTLLHTLTGHTKDVYAVAFSPDGKLLASGGIDQVIKIWDVCTGQETMALAGHDASIRALAFHPTRPELASGGSKGSQETTIRVWDLTAKTSRTLSGHDGHIYGLSYTAAGSLFSAASDGRILVWDNTSHDIKRCFASLTVPKINASFSLSRDGQTVAVADADQVTHVWKTKTGEEVARLPMATQPNNIALTPDGSRLATAGVDGIVRVWQVDTGREVLTLRGHSAMVYGLGFSEDGWQLFSGSADCTLKVWDTTTTQEKLTILCGKSLSAVALSPDERLVVTAGPKEPLRVWDVDTGHEVRALGGNPEGTTDICFVPTSGLLFSTDRDGTAQLWDVENGAVVKTLEGPHQSLRCCACSANGEWLAAGGDDGTIFIWDSETGQIIRRLKQHSGHVEVIAFHPSKQQLVSIGKDRITRVVRFDTHEIIFSLNPELDSHGSAPAFTPDGRFLVAGADLGIWGLHTGEKSRSLKSDRQGQTNLLVSDEGRRVIATGPEFVRIWDFATGQELLTLPGHTDRGVGVAIGKRGDCLVSVDCRGFLQIWNAAPRSPERLAALEAASLVRFLSGPDTRREDVMERVRQHPSVSEPVRRRALELAAHAGPKPVEAQPK